MAKLASFRDLVVWRLASEFSSIVYKLVKTFPKDERFSLSDDLLRAARSIPANIAEGWGRYYPKEKISFYNIANGSAEECVNHIVEAKNAGYIEDSMYNSLNKRIHVISVKLTNLMAATRSRAKNRERQTSERRKK